MKFINFAIVKFSAFLVLGILAAHYLPSNSFFLSYLVIILAIVAVLWFWSRKQLVQQVYFGIATYCCFFSIGYFAYQIPLFALYFRKQSRFSTVENKPELKTRQLLSKVFCNDNRNKQQSRSRKNLTEYFKKIYKTIFFAR